MASARKNLHGGSLGCLAVKKLKHAGNRMERAESQMTKVAAKYRHQTGDGAGKFLMYKKWNESHNANEAAKPNVKTMTQDKEFQEKWANANTKKREALTDRGNEVANEKLISESLGKLKKLHKQSKTHVTQVDMFMYYFFTMLAAKTKKALQIDMLTPIQMGRSFTRQRVRDYGEEMTHPKMDNVIKKMGDVDKITYKTENLAPNHICQTICYVFNHFKNAEVIEQNPEGENQEIEKDFAKWAKIEPGKYMVAQHDDEAWLVAGVQLKPYRVFLVPLQGVSHSVPVGNLQGQTFNLGNYNTSVDDSITLGGSAVGDFWGFQLYWGDPDDTDRITVRSRGLIIVKAQVDKPAAERTTTTTRSANLREKISENAQLKAEDRKS